MLRSLTHVPIIASTAASRMFSTSQLEAEADPHGAPPCAKAAAVCILFSTFEHVSECLSDV